MITIQILDHSPRNPYASDAWATTDRGWIYAVRDDITYDATTCLGHYLDYGPCGRPSPSVHAVSCVTREARYFHTPREANAWLLSQAAGHIAEHVASEALRRGAYQHEADAIARLPVDESAQANLF